MGNFRQGGGKRFGGGHGEGSGGRDGGRPNFFKKSWNGSEDRDRGPVTMHQAVCGQCGSPCEVPFRPLSGKPVYCNNCFKDKREAGDNRGGDRFPQKSFNDYKSFAKPDFRSNAGGENANGEIKRQLEILNSKMDRLVRAVESMANVNPLVIEEKIMDIDKDLVEIVPGVKIEKEGKKAAKKRKSK